MIFSYPAILCYNFYRLKKKQSLPSEGNTQINPVEPSSIDSDLISSNSAYSKRSPSKSSKSPSSLKASSRQKGSQNEISTGFSMNSQKENISSLRSISKSNHERTHIDLLENKYLQEELVKAVKARFNDQIDTQQNAKNKNVAKETTSMQTKGDSSDDDIEGNNRFLAMNIIF